MKMTYYPLPHLPFRLPNKLLQNHLFRKLNKLETILFHFLQDRNNSFRFSTQVPQFFPRPLKFCPSTPEKNPPPKKDIFPPLSKITEKRRGNKTAFFYRNLFIATKTPIPNIILSLPKKKLYANNTTKQFKTKKNKNCLSRKKNYYAIILVFFFPPTHKTPKTHLLAPPNNLKKKIIKTYHPLFLLFFSSNNPQKNQDLKCTSFFCATTLTRFCTYPSFFFLTQNESPNQLFSLNCYHYY